MKMHQLAFITKTQFLEKDGLSELGSLTFMLLSMCDIFATLLFVMCDLFAFVLRMKAPY